MAEGANPRRSKRRPESRCGDLDGEPSLPCSHSALCRRGRVHAGLSACPGRVVFGGSHEMPGAILFCGISTVCLRVVTQLGCPGEDGTSPVVASPHPDWLPPPCAPQETRQRQRVLRALLGPLLSLLVSVCQCSRFWWRTNLSSQPDASFWFGCWLGAFAARARWIEKARPPASG